MTMLGVPCLMAHAVLLYTVLSGQDLVDYCMFGQRRSDTP